MSDTPLPDDDRPVDLTGSPHNCGDPTCPGCNPSEHATAMRTHIVLAAMEASAEMGRLASLNRSDMTVAMAIVGSKIQALISLVGAAAFTPDELDTLKANARLAKRHLLRHHHGMTDAEIDDYERAVAYLTN